MNNLYPYEPDYAVSPGEILDEYLESYEMTQDELAQQLELSAETMLAIMKAQSPIIPEIAIKLQKVFQRPDHFWITLQRNYDQKLTRLEQRKPVSSFKYKLAAEILHTINPNQHIPIRASSTPILKRSCSIAMSTGNGSRIGSLKNRTQVQSPKAGRYVERDTTTGQFINQKSDDKPFKGVAKEQGRRSK